MDILVGKHNLSRIQIFKGHSIYLMRRRNDWGKFYKDFGEKGKIIYS